MDGGDGGRPFEGDDVVVGDGEDRGEGFSLGKVLLNGLFCGRNARGERESILLRRPSPISAFL